MATGSSSERKVAIFAVDPGGNTGIAMGVFLPNQTLYKTLHAVPYKLSMTVDGSPLEQARRIFHLWRKFYGLSLSKYQVPRQRCWMIVEDFILSPNAAPGKDILLATKVAHTLMGYRYGAADEFDRNRAEPIFPMQVVWQTAAEAKTFVTDQRLKRWDIWIKGRQHERDAFRHLAYFLSREIR